MRKPPSGEKLDGGRFYSECILTFAIFQSILLTQLALYLRPQEARVKEFQKRVRDYLAATSEQQELRDRVLNLRLRMLDLRIGIAEAARLGKQSSQRTEDDRQTYRNLEHDLRRFNAQLEKAKRDVARTYGFVVATAAGGEDAHGVPPHAARQPQPARSRGQRQLFDQ